MRCILTNAHPLLVATQIKTGKIVWINGPFAGSVNDKTIFRDRLFERATLDHATGLADKGYICAEFEQVLAYPTSGGVLRRPLAREEEAVNRCIATVRIHIERLMGLLKVWDILKDPWRGERSDHVTVFEVICRLTNLRLTALPLIRTLHPLLEGLPFRLRPLN